jgi:hypothetical protein
MATEAAAHITDLVTAQLVECTPKPESVPCVIPEPPDTSPVEASAHATIEQTGADPPPDVSLPLQPSPIES